MPFCTNCGNPINEDFVFCPECGKPISLDGQDDNFQSKGELSKKCPVCGEMMPIDMFYCLNCGYDFRNEQSVDDDLDFQKLVHHIQMTNGTWKNKWVSLILCVFFGYLGIHRFYEGKIISGLIYLVTLGIFGLGWIFDIIRISLKPNPYRTR